MTEVFNRYTKGEEETVLSRLPAPDRALVERFIKERSALGTPLSQGRVKKIIFSLATIRALSPVPFGQLSEDSVIEILHALKKKGWKDNTVRDVIAVMKLFLTELVKKGKAPALTMAFIDGIKIPPPPREKVRAEDLLSQDEIDAVIKAASPRDRAIISLMTDGALRPIEAATLRCDQIEFTNGTMYVVVDAKTKKERRIPCPVAMYYVQAWIDAAPYPIGPRDLLFRSSRFDPETGEYPSLMDDALRWCIRQAAKKAGVQRYTHPYQFRHGAITRWMDAGLSTAKVSVLSHGGPSRMVEAVYWSPDQQQIADEVMQKVHGRGPAEKVKANPTTRVCTVCGKIYPLSIQYCGTCGPLTQEAAGDLASLEALIANLSPAELVRLLIKKDPALASEVLAKK